MQQFYSRWFSAGQISKYTFVDNVQWAEVLSADAFSAFEDAGLDDIKVYAAKQTY